MLICRIFTLLFLTANVLSLVEQLGLDALDSQAKPIFNIYMGGQNYKPTSETSTYTGSNNQTTSYDIYESISGTKNYLLFSEMNNYTGNSPVSGRTLPASGSIELEFADSQLIYKLSKQASLADKCMTKITVEIQESNCLYLFGQIADSSFQTEMRNWKGEDVKEYGEKNGYSFIIANLDAEVFDFELYTFKVTPSDAKNPFPPQIAGSSLEYTNSEQELDHFYVTCPYFDSPTPKLKINVSGEFEKCEPEDSEESEDPDDPPPPPPVLNECDKQESKSECEKKNSDEIEEYIEKFDNTPDFRDNKLEITTSNEDDREEEKENFKVEDTGGLFAPKEYKIETKIGKISRMTKKLIQANFQPKTKLM